MRADDQEERLSRALEYAKQILAKCPIDQKNHVNNVLSSATSELKLFDNLTGSHRLLMSVLPQLKECKPYGPPEPPGASSRVSPAPPYYEPNPNAEFTDSLTKAFRNLTPMTLIFTLLIVSATFGILWYRAHKFEHRDIRQM